MINRRPTSLEIPDEDPLRVKTLSLIKASTLYHISVSWLCMSNDYNYLWRYSVGHQASF